MRVYVADKELLNRLLDTTGEGLFAGERPEEVDLGKILKEILRSANEFLPSESGSILLNTGPLKENTTKQETLHFVACFGKGSAKLTKMHIPANIGIVGETYQSGKPYISESVSTDKNFFSDIDKKTKFETKSVICTPINLKSKTIGVLELINKLDSVNFTDKDITLLKIFADYTSTLIQNALDAKRYQDFSICDSLTGLYNDRYFFDAIPKEVRRTLKKTRKKDSSDLYLIFVDIDNLKVINDTHGHLAGNRVLSQIGCLLSLTKLTKRTSISRYGGDEFVIIVPDSDFDSIVEYSEILRIQIETNVFLRLREITEHESTRARVTASIGIASLKKNVSLKMKEETIIKCLIKQADTAMYRSKSTGKNKVSIAEGKLSL